MSTFSFVPCEIFEIIAKTEATVSKFYAHLAQLGLGEEASKIFSVLSEEEAGHGQIFLKMAQLQKEKHEVAEEFSVNIRVILECAIQRIDRSLLSLTPLGRKSIDFRQCVEIAIRHEKDSIAVYTEMLKAMPHEFSDVFAKTIVVEKGHLRTLENVLNDYSPA